jgi:hypothetical protein
MRHVEMTPEMQPLAPSTGNAADDPFGDLIPVEVYFCAYTY